MRGSREWKQGAHRGRVAAIGEHGEVRRRRKRRSSSGGRTENRRNPTDWGLPLRGFATDDEEGVEAVLLLLLARREVDHGVPASMAGLQLLSLPWFRKEKVQGKEKRKEEDGGARGTGGLGHQGGARRRGFKEEEGTLLAIPSTVF